MWIRQYLLNSHAPSEQCVELCDLTLHRASSQARLPVLLQAQEEDDQGQEEVIPGCHEDEQEDRHHGGGEDAHMGVINEFLFLARAGAPRRAVDHLPVQGKVDLGVGDTSGLIGAMGWGR